MERKIGEIFKLNGDWYQCVKGECKDCDFSKDTFYCKYLIERDFCKAKSVFKKLEKVGEPYEFDGHLFQSYRTFEVPIFTENYATVRELGNNSKISIEIKQNKEDMEDLDKIKVRDYTKVEELNVMEEKKLNLKPFDIQKAREGKLVCTRDGRKARIICFDAKGTHPIIALVSDPDIEGTEIPFCYTNSGFYNNPNCESNHDLMILPEKKEGWVNIYTLNTCYSSKEEAEANIDRDYEHEYVRTVKIKWEE